MINIYDFCIYTASILPIISTIAYLITKYNDIIYAYTLFLSASAPIVLGLKLSMTPESILNPYFFTIAIIFIIYILVAAVFGIICFSYCMKEKKKKARLVTSQNCSNWRLKPHSKKTLWGFPFFNVFYTTILFLFYRHKKTSFQWMRSFFSFVILFP